MENSVCPKYLVVILCSKGVVIDLIIDVKILFKQMRFK